MRASGAEKRLGFGVSTTRERSILGFAPSQASEGNLQRRFAAAMGFHYGIRARSPRWVPSGEQSRVLSHFTLAPGGDSLTGIEGLAFDRDGNLWVVYASSNVVARFGSADLGGTGPRTATPSIQLETTLSGVLHGLAFDEAGGIWLPYGNAKLARLAPSQLAVSGPATPATIVDGIRLGTVLDLAFFPGAKGTPLYHALR